MTYSSFLVFQTCIKMTRKDVTSGTNSSDAPMTHAGICLNTAQLNLPLDL